MAEPRILIAGGTGVFGRLLARELLDRTSVDLVLAGRTERKAARAPSFHGCGGRVRSLVLDLRNPAALERAAEGCLAVACAAGPFQALPADLPRAAVRASAHWLDISDHREWVVSLLADRALDVAASAAGVAVLPGLSTVPALSGVLARSCLKGLPDARRARITLFIGNRNPKGVGSIRSALESGFADPSPVELPFGRRIGYRFESPDADLLREEIDLDAEFRVVFEWGITGRVAAAARPLARRLGEGRFARWLALLSAPFERFGSDAGCLQVEVWNAEGRRAAAAFLGVGQRMAILPCALALEALLGGEVRWRGVRSPATLLATEDWVARLGGRGLEFRTLTRDREPSGGTKQTGGRLPPPAPNAPLRPADA